MDAMSGTGTDEGEGTGRTPRPRSLLRSRGAVTASLVAALLGGGATAGACRIAMDHPDTGTAAAVKALIPQVDPRSLSGQAYLAAQPADCLAWQLDAREQVQSIARVDCAQPHAFEVAARVDLAATPGYESGTAFPEGERRARVGTERCVPAVEQYTGGRAVDPAGRFTVTVVPPSREGWDKGDHSALCGLSTTELDGSPSVSTGRFAEADQHRVWEPGTCLGFTATGMPGRPVDCAREHSVEVVSTLDVTPLFPAGAEVPDPRTQSELTGRACHEAGVAYTGGDPEALRRSTLIATQVSPLSEVAWSTGSRTVDCGVMKARDESAFAVLTGSVRGPLLVDGTPPVAPTTTSLPAPAGAPAAPGAGGSAPSVVPTGPSDGSSGGTSGGASGGSADGGA